ncbi:MAG: hypothetical protein GY950_11100 [bacterium]|nr:hypothetical protein [bacterium]
MILKESLNLVRAYFFALFIFAGYFNVVFILDGITTMDKIFGILGLALALCFLIIGIKFKPFLVNTSAFIFSVLITAGIWLAVKSLLSLIIGKNPMALLHLVIGGAVLWYLYKNVNRLAQEEMKKAI